MELPRRAWRRARGLDPRLVDGLVVVILTAVVVVELSHYGNLSVRWAGRLRSIVPLFRLAGPFVSTVPLLWRRRFPIGSYLVQNLGLFLWLAPPLVSALVAVFFGCYSMGVHSSRRRVSAALPVGQAAVLAAVGIPNDFYTPPVPAWVAELVAGMGMWLAGNAIRGAEERTRRLERERTLVTQVAVAEEQARIARELHDVVAHSVSIMVVQAGAARRLLPGNPERATQALQAVETSGREALGELRHLLGVLNEEGGEAAISPQPGLAQLDTLVDRLRGTGFPVEIRSQGRPQPLAPGLELAAFRVVQEALTNALKHAGAAPTRVLLQYGERELDIEVLDAGGQPAPEAKGTGRGLLGMRQRVEMYGGQLEAGPRLEGGFAVRARLPLEPAPPPPSRGEGRGGED